MKCARLSSGASDLDCPSGLPESAAISEHDAVANWKQNVFDPVVLLNAIVQGCNRPRVLFPGTENPAAAQHIVQDDEPARPHQIDGAIVIIVIAFFICVDETKIKGTLQSLQRFPRRSELDLNLFFRKRSQQNSGARLPWSQG